MEPAIPASSAGRASPAAMARFQDLSPNRSATSATGLARTPSLRSSRPIRRTPQRLSVSTDVDGEDAKAVNTQIIADLKEQVERAEQASEHYRRQLEALQQRLDEVSNETTAAEEREFSFRTQIDKLHAEVRESARQNRELELSYESEKKMLLQERERQTTKEIELQSVVSRLTESLRFKNQELVNTSKMDISSREDMPLADDGFLEVLHAKDSQIEALRLEVADFHLKMAEQEHVGDGRSQILENELLETKMRNARLLEENESFQMLLSEKTLKGDFMHDQRSTTAHISSLAEELESAEGTEPNADTYRLMEAENKTLRDSNKALTTYIDKIIGRILETGYEHIMTGNEEKPTPPTKTEKKLPEVPEAMTEAASTVANAAAGFLQRARSVVARPTARPRPLSVMSPSTTTMPIVSPTANENPQTAPSIPIRGHRRTRSEQAHDIGAAAIVAQMNRGSPLRTASGPLSPGISPMSPMSNQRSSYFGPSRGPSGSVSARPDSSSNSIGSDHSYERESTDASSNRLSIHAKESTESGSNRTSMLGVPATGLPGAVMKQSQLRPLRLVQEQKDEDAKKNNRGSWMGWFQKTPIEGPNE